MSKQKKRSSHDDAFGELLFDFKYDDGSVSYKASTAFLVVDPVEFTFYAKSESEDDLRHVLGIGHELLRDSAVVGESISSYMDGAVLRSLEAIDTVRLRKFDKVTLEKSWKLVGVDVYFDGDVRAFFDPDQILQIDHGLQIYMDSKGHVRDHEFIS